MNGEPLRIDSPVVRRRVVKGWAFQNLPAEEVAAIKRFLATGRIAALPESRRGTAVKYARGDLR